MGLKHQLTKIPPTNYHLSAAKQEPYQKAYLLTKNNEEFSGEKGQENGPVGRKKRDRKKNGSRQKNKRPDSKVESNDSPEILDRGDIRQPRPPFGVGTTG